MSGETAFTPPEEEINAPIPQPLLWRVLVRPLQAPEVTEGGIALTKQIQENQEFVTVVGQIVAKGPRSFLGEKFTDGKLEVGDWVLYPTYGGQRIELADGRTFILLNDDQLLGRVDDPEPYRKKFV